MSRVNEGVIVGEENILPAISGEWKGASEASVGRLVSYFDMWYVRGAKRRSEGIS